MKKIGLFGGTFDPPHFGHLNLAIQLLEKKSLDLVLFCPARRSPFKEAPIASVEDRTHMVRLALEGLPLFQFCDIGMKQSGLTYTIETLRALRLQLPPHTELYLLLSNEALPSFHLWKEVDELIRLAPPLVGVRHSPPPEAPPSSVRQALQQGFIETMQMEISSTEVRDRISKNLPCLHLVPRNVLDYIFHHRVYF